MLLMTEAVVSFIPRQSEFEFFERLTALQHEAQDAWPVQIRLL